MTKSELISRLADRHPHLVATDAELAVKAIIDAMVESLVAGQRIFDTGQQTQLAAMQIGNRHIVLLDDCMLAIQNGIGNRHYFIGFNRIHRSLADPNRSL